MRWLVAVWIALVACGPTEHAVVEPSPTGISITPTAPLLVVGMTAQLTATASFADGSTQDITARVDWSSSAAGVATVSASGSVTGVAAGTAAITAELDGATGTVTIDVTASPLTAIAVTPAIPTLPLGTHQQLAATATFGDGSTADVTAMAMWTTDRPQIATVSAGGLVAADAVGAATITATLGPVTGTAMVGVTAAALVSIDIAALSATVPQGYAEQLAATGTFTDGSMQDITADVTWSSSNTGMATISGAGMVAAVAAGSPTITAVNGTITGAMRITIDTAALQAIAIAPTTPAVARGTTQQLAAMGTFSDAVTLDLTSQVTWASSNTALATISSAGLASAIAVGTPMITATRGAVVGSTTLVVTSAALQSITVTPANENLAKGLTQQYTATGNLADSTTTNLTALVTWSSSDTTIAQITAAGIATALAAGGPVTITARLGALAGTTMLTATPPAIASITVAPANPAIDPGATQAFTASATLTDATTEDVTQTATWTSSATGVATMAGNVATGVSPGPSTITATVGAVHGATTLTINGLALLAITPGDATTGVASLTPIVLTFNQPPSPLTITATSSSTCSGSVQLSANNFASCLALGTATFDGTGKVATLRPVSRLSPSTTYRVRVLSTVATAGGSALAGTVTQPTGFTTNAGVCAETVVISQIYGGGGNTGATYDEDFVELHNVTSSAVAISGWTVQYEAGAGSTWMVTNLPAGASIPAGGYYLVGMFLEAGVGAALPTPDATGTTNLSINAGKVVLSSTPATMTATCPAIGGAVVDVVFYGSGACTPSAPTLNSQSSAMRGGGGCTDTGNVATDLSTEPVLPGNSTSTALTCGCD